MLTRLRIKNFQGLELLDIQLDSHVTTIVGPTDAGKSACIRALRWLCVNRPSGDGFIRVGTAAAVVTLEVDDHKIVRKRGARGNVYKLDGQTLKAFGNDVPDLVANLLNVSGTNFQGQLDAHFWFSETRPHITRELNRIVNLEVIDTSLNNIKQTIRTATNSISAHKALRAKSREAVAQQKWVVAASRRFEHIRELRQTALDANAKLSLLAGLVQSVAKCQRATERGVAVAERGENVVRLGEAAEKAVAQRAALAAHVIKIKQLRIDAAWQKSQLAAKQKELARLEAMICPTCQQPMSGRS